MLRSREREREGCGTSTSRWSQGPCRCGRPQTYGPCGTTMFHGWCVQGVRFFNPSVVAKKPTESMTSPCDAWLSERMFCTPTKNFLVARPCPARRVAHVSSNKHSIPRSFNSPLRTSWQKDTHWILVYISTQHALFYVVCEESKIMCRPRLQQTRCPTLVIRVRHASRADGSHQRHSQHLVFASTTASRK